MEKVYMSSPRLFGYSVCDAGCNAFMSKFDSADAYKNVPCRIYDLRLQGFSWLSKFFIETKQINKFSGPEQRWLTTTFWEIRYGPWY
jgi:hypothetical protein